MREMVILVPSRNRPQNIAQLIDALDETDTTADLIVIVDDSEPQMDAYLELDCDVFMVAKDGRGMAKPLNAAANHFRNKYHHFCFLGDDHRPRTKNWDRKFIEALHEMGTGLVYGDDLIQGENLATAICMTSDIVRKLHGMVPPNMMHLYLDNFWMKLGNDLEKLKYLPEVIIEHMHPIAGKAQMDQGYLDVNAAEVYASDKMAFIDYIESNEYHKLLKALG